MFAPGNYNWKKIPNPCFEIIFSEKQIEYSRFSEVIWWNIDNPEKQINEKFTIADI